MITVRDVLIDTLTRAVQSAILTQAQATGVLGALDQVWATDQTAQQRLDAVVAMGHVTQEWADWFATNNPLILPCITSGLTVTADEVAIPWRAPAMRSGTLRLDRRRERCHVHEDS